MKIFISIITIIISYFSIKKASKFLITTKNKMLPEYDSSNFVDITTIIPDILLDIRYYSTYNFVGERINGYKESIALMTKEAANALKKASDYLKEKGYLIKIYDSYRPQRSVDHFVNWTKNNDTKMKKYFYPDIEIDMGSTFDFFGEISHPNYTNITNEQKKNRQFLIDSMKLFNFEVIDTEWWHFYLKNQPFPNTYFDFEVSRESLKQNKESAFLGCKGH